GLWAHLRRARRHASDRLGADPQGAAHSTGRSIERLGRLLWPFSGQTARARRPCENSSSKHHWPFWQEQFSFVWKVRKGAAMRRQVVVTGIGVVSSAGIGKEKFWAGLLSGKSFIRR